MQVMARDTTLLLTLFQSKVCTQSYEPPKLQESQLWEFQDSHLGVPRQKCHLGVGPMAKHKVCYKGKGGGFPQV
jgi:hypothetical protein